MIVSSNIPSSGLIPARPPGTRMLAAIDVEWSKNYRIRGGNVPFCYSVIWLPLPASGASTGLDTARFWYTSAYVEDTSECADLVARADAALAMPPGARQPDRRPPAVQRPGGPGRSSHRRATTSGRRRSRRVAAAAAGPLRPAALPRHPL